MWPSNSVGHTVYLRLTEYCASTIPQCKKKNVFGKVCKWRLSAFVYLKCLYFTSFKSFFFLTWVHKSSNFSMLKLICQFSSFHCCCWAVRLSLCRCSVFCMLFPEAFWWCCKRLLSPLDSSRPELKCYQRTRCWGEVTSLVRGRSCPCCSSQRSSELWKARFLKGWVL